MRSSSKGGVTGSKHTSIQGESPNPDFGKSTPLLRSTARMTVKSAPQAQGKRKFYQLGGGADVTVYPGDQLPDWLCDQLKLAQGSKYEDLP